ncbi:unnamed protein product [Ixodes hexagonus]
MAGIAAEEVVKDAKSLVVGAGGIGCELLKNLVLSGFSEIEVIDLDTIDVSNLNRQFLFQKVHVGKSKALVAKESAEKLNPSVKIKAHHDSIIKPEYGVDFFKQFSIVMNALDNRGARSHVNRMCLAANVPLIESGTAGYLGQVSPIFKGATECYECQPHPAQKTYPGCTIRNTPSEPIHCIVWAKHLFNQLFGEADADEDVSPDSADPELGGGEVDVEKLVQQQTNSTGNIHRVSTRVWAVNCGYDSQKLFNKLFNDDIRYLLQMEKLWKRRKPPCPLKWSALPDALPCGSTSTCRTGDQRLWSMQECGEVFGDSLTRLKMRVQALPQGDHLVWDKDNKECLDFVTACSNLRAHCFGIPQTSKFDVKAMAGNIIPAIATTNAIIAGLIVLQAFKILQGKREKCNTVYLNQHPTPKKQLVIPTRMVPPNPKCYACSSNAEVYVNLNTKQTTLRVLEEKILKEQIQMSAPDVEIDDGKGTILISSEEGETEGNKTYYVFLTGNHEKYLADLGVVHGSRLRCDDFLQNFQLTLNVIHKEDLKDGVEFEIVGDISQLQPKEDLSNDESNDTASKSKDVHANDDDDDLVCIEEETPTSLAAEIRKRKNTDSGDVQSPKRPCIIID